jgi:hypothetical protein
MIKAECHSDDRAIEIKFDATKWFEQASPKEIKDLKDSDWGFDYPSDEIAIFMADYDQDIKDMFKYIEVRHKFEHIGFECSVDEDDAEKWLKEKGIENV